MRDLNQDFSDLGRSYFPNVDLNEFDETNKKKIEKEIDDDFHQALQGIKLLPLGSRFGVYVAYIYYLTLFKKIKNTDACEIMKSRIRIPNSKKASLLAYSYVKFQLNRI